MRTRLALLCAALLGLAMQTGCADAGQRLYDNSDLVLLTNHGAKELCSCLFTMEMPEEFCRAYVKENPDLASYRIDTEKKTVEAGALLFFGAKAKWVDAQQGCLLED